MGHAGGRRSRAQVQQCVLCGANIAAGIAHGVFFCPALLAQRRQLLAAAGWSEAPQVSAEALASLLRLAPGEPGFCELVLLLAELDRAAGQFWLLQGHAEA